VPDRGVDGVGRREKRGLLTPGKELIEPTSGNTGIALAFVCAARGYKITLTMPDTMSLERRRVLKMLGANLELTPGDDGMYGSITRAEEMIASDPERYVMLQQFKNPANPAIHFETTGPEIWEDTAGAIDVLVAGVGTGGTISGISRYIKQKQGKKILSPRFRELARASFLTPWTSRSSTASKWWRTKKPSSFRGAWREKRGFCAASRAALPPRSPAGSPRSPRWRAS
jgi:hypothetical protein